MATNPNSNNNGNITGSLSLNPIVNDLQQLTQKLKSISKQFNEVQQDAKVSEMVQDQVMTEYARMKSELELYKQKLSETEEAKQNAVGMNYTIGEQTNEIKILYGTLKQYHLAIKEGLELLFEHRSQDETALKYKKLFAKNIDAAAHQVVMRLCGNPDLYSGKAIDCAKFFRANTCEALPLPLFDSDKEDIDEIMKSANTK